MPRLTLRASDFVVYGPPKGRLAGDGIVVVARHSAEPSIRVVRNALRHAVASARLESVPIDDAFRFEIVKQAMKPLRERHDPGRMRSSEK